MGSWVAALGVLGGYRGREIGSDQIELPIARQKRCDNQVSPAVRCGCLRWWRESVESFIRGPGLWLPLCLTCFVVGLSRRMQKIRAWVAGQESSSRAGTWWG